MTIIKNGCVCGEDYYTTTEQCDNIDCDSQRKEEYYLIEICPKCKKQKWFKCLDCNKRTIIKKVKMENK